MKYLLSIVSIVLLAACNQGGADEYTLSGIAQGFEDGTKVYVYGVDSNNQPVVEDTLKITDGAFTAVYLKKDTTALNYLIVEGIRNNIIFFSKTRT